MGTSRTEKIDNLEMISNIFWKSIFFSKFWLMTFDLKKDMFHTSDWWQLLVYETGDMIVTKNWNFLQFTIIEKLLWKFYFSGLYHFYTNWVIYRFIGINCSIFLLICYHIFVIKSLIYNLMNRDFRDWKNW